MQRLSVIEQRIAAIEQAKAGASTRMRFIFKVAGRNDDELVSLHHKETGQHWVRMAGEPLGDFSDRAFSELERLAPGAFAAMLTAGYI